MSSVPIPSKQNIVIDYKICSVIILSFFAAMPFRNSARTGTANIK